MESKAITDTDIDDLIKHLNITRYVDFRHFRNICSLMKNISSLILLASFQSTHNNNEVNIIIPSAYTSLSETLSLLS